MRLQDIESIFAKRGKILGGMLLLQPNAALDFLEECNRAEFKVVGVEGFKINGNKIQPFQEHSNDIADTNYTPEEFFAETKRFLFVRNALDLWFEVVIIE
jgi:hypothetical protein